jgi:dCTP deaminase
MSYLNHDEILELCRSGAMEDWDEACINAASMDVRLGAEVALETTPDYSILDYRNRQRPTMATHTLTDKGAVFIPGTFFLAHTIEKCNFPDDVAALFRIKSSMGRCGLEHMDAGWVDPGFNGSLTLEFKVMLNKHSIRLHPGDRIGQLIFLRGNPVSAEKSYRTVGNYNGATGIKPIGFNKGE